MIKNLMWLIKHKDEIERMLEIFNAPIEEDKPKKEEDQGYSIAGVPDFQKEYVKDLLSGKLKDN